MLRTGEKREKHPKSKYRYLLAQISNDPKTIGHSFIKTEIDHQCNDVENSAGRAEAPSDWTRQDYH